MRDKQQTTEQTLKIELLSQWMIEAEFRKKCSSKCIPKKCPKVRQKYRQALEAALCRVERESRREKEGSGVKIRWNRGRKE